MRNYYEILEVPFTASHGEIQRAYQNLSKKYHPDNNGGIGFFNTVYQEIQEAYKVLSDERLKAEYDKKNNISYEGASSANDPAPHTKNAPRNVKSGELNSKEPKVKSFRIIKFALAAIFIIAIGYFISLSLPSSEKDIPEGANEMGFDFRNSNEENLKHLLDLESSRDFDVLSTFYSKNVVKYWNSSNLDEDGLKKQYSNAWNKSSNSKNNILDIQKVDDNTLDVKIEFSFVDNSTKNTVSHINLNRYVFNNYGLITQVYNVDPVKEYDEYRDGDFSFISNEEKIRRLLNAEDNRDFNKIASFYSKEIDRYWHLENIGIPDIKKQYDKSWSITSNSYNTILSISEIDYNKFLLRTRFYFETVNNQNEVRISDNIYVFNSEGLITQVFGANTI